MMNKNPLVVHYYSYLLSTNNIFLFNELWYFLKFKKLYNIFTFKIITLYNVSILIIIFLFQNYTIKIIICYVPMRLRV